MITTDAAPWMAVIATQLLHRNITFLVKGQQQRQLPKWPLVFAVCYEMLPLMRTPRAPWRNPVRVRQLVKMGMPPDTLA